MSEFCTPPDLTDPVQVANQCTMYGEYVAQQAEAIARGTATGSHPNPGHFYGEMARTLKAAASLLNSRPGVSVPPPVEPKEDKPAAVVEEKPKPQPTVDEKLAAATEEKPKPAAKAK